MCLKVGHLWHLAACIYTYLSCYLLLRHTDCDIERVAKEGAGARTQERARDKRLSFDEAREISMSQRDRKVYRTGFPIRTGVCIVQHWYSRDTSNVLTEYYICLFHLVLHT